MSDSIKSNKIDDMQKAVQTKAEELLKHRTKKANSVSALSSKEIIDALNNNESGDALLYTKLNRNRLCYDHSAKTWHKWQNHHWEDDKIGDALIATESVVDEYKKELSRQRNNKIQARKNGNKNQEEAAECIIKLLDKRINRLQSLSRKKNVLGLARCGTNSLGIAGDEWDSNPYLLGCRNGVVDLRTGQFRSGKPQDYIKTFAPHDFLGLDAPAPKFVEYLNEMLDSDKVLIEFIQRLFGCGIFGLSDEHIFSIFYGPGRNGKSTLFEIIASVIGNHAFPIPSEMLLRQSFTRNSSAPSPDIMSLRGKRIVWASESDEGRPLDISRLKWLSGGDTLVGRRLYEKEITFAPTHTPFLLTNNKPRITPDDYAVWDRIHLIPFNYKFVNDPKTTDERKRNPNLKRELMSEASGILAWLVKGAVEYFENGLNPPSIVLEATKEYRENEDIVGQFIKDCCLPSTEHRVQAQVLYDCYKRWCDANGYEALGTVKFSKRIISKDFQKVKEGNMYYKGIKLQTS